MLSGRNDTRETQRTAQQNLPRDWWRQFGGHRYISRQLRDLYDDEDDDDDDETDYDYAYDSDDYDSNDGTQDEE